MADDIAGSSGNKETTRRRRRDRGHLHTTRHAILSKHPLEALHHLGEDVRVLRRMEHRLRVALKPTGDIGELLFDRCYSSYLRCLLAGRLEARRLMSPESRLHCGEPSLIERDVPTLVQAEESQGVAIGATLPPDIFRELVLIQRYDRHFGREMYRALAMLLVLRDSDEAGLEQCIRQMLGVKKGGES